MRFLLVVFDLDGTLIDSLGDIADALNAALTDVGLPPQTDERVAGMVGDGARVLVMRGMAGRLPERTDEVLRRYVEHYKARPTGRTRLYPGVREGLVALASVRRVIATNKPGALARLIADDLGLTPLVDRVLGAGDVARIKPDPAMLEEAMRSAGASRDETLYVGDGPVDVQTAERAEVPLCLVSWGYDGGISGGGGGEEISGVEGASQPAYRVSRFEEIVRLVLGEGSGRPAGLKR